MEEERILKVRLYTDIKPNYVLVGQNTFTKNLVIFEKQMFHMPWYKTRFVKMTQRNLDIPPVTVETDNGTLQVKVDAAINWCVIKPEFKNEEGNSIIKRWSRFLFSRSTGRLILDIILFIIASIGVCFLSPWLLIPIYSIAATGISLSEFHDTNWAKEQGPCKAAFQESSVAQLEQTIQQAISTYYSKKSYSDIKSQPLSLEKIYDSVNNPELSQIKDKLELIKNEHGISICGTGLLIKTADYDEASDKLLKKQREIELTKNEQTMKNNLEIDYRRQQIALDKQKIQAIMQPVIEGLINNGASPEAISETLKYMGISSTGGTVIAGNAVPFVNVNPNSTSTSDTYTYDTDSNDDEAVKQKRKTR